jgi:hypothetical protein
MIHLMDAVCYLPVMAEFIVQRHLTEADIEERMGV